VLARHVIAQAIIDYTNPGNTVGCKDHQDSAEKFLLSNEDGWKTVREFWFDSAHMPRLSPATVKRAVKTWTEGSDFKKLDEILTKLKAGSAIKKSLSLSQQPSSSQSSGSPVN